MTSKLTVKTDSTFDLGLASASRLITGFNDSHPAGGTQTSRNAESAWTQFVREARGEDPVLMELVPVEESEDTSDETWKPTPGMIYSAIGLVVLLIFAVLTFLFTSVVVTIVVALVASLGAAVVGYIFFSVLLWDGEWIANRGDGVAFARFFLMACAIAAGAAVPLTWWI